MQQVQVARNRILVRMGLSRRRLLELALEVLVGLGIVAAVILYTEIGPFSWMPSAHWWVLAGMTALLVWTTINHYRHAWRRPGFWLGIAGLLTVHCVAWTVVILRTGAWGLIWFVPPTILEAVIFVSVLIKLGYGPPHLRGSGRAA